jgi:type IV pilus assembly protein PilA
LLKETVKIKMKKNQQGFSLIELLIVVVIIGIIAAIAIPNLLASRRAANEASSISAMRTVGSSEATYFSTAGANANYGDAAALFASNLIDNVMAAAHGVNVGGNPPTGQPKSGYTFAVTVTPANAATAAPATYVDSAVPAVATGVTATGTRRFCITEDGVLRYSPTSTGGAVAYAACQALSAN